MGALIGKAAAATKISSQSTATRAKHLRDFDSLARMLGPDDRAEANLSKSEKKLLDTLAGAPDLGNPGGAALRLLLG